jgi:diadenosine tetraphosphate (Ap4A) HIT family hydrolase
MNETIRRFGYPETLIAEYDHWVVLLRPAQPTLGSLILAAKGEATAFCDLEPPAFGEMHRVIAAIEHSLHLAISYERINYLMLMMVDPHVHFHVIPRYPGTRGLGDYEIEDTGWPKAPDLGQALTLERSQIEAFKDFILSFWPSGR